MKIHLLSGFLGSGKTTAIQHAANILVKQHKKVGVITNDQGAQLVDGDFFQTIGLPNRQVMNGCFCCNYNDLDQKIQSLADISNTDIIFAESVGSCTDIVATVLKPLLKYRPATDVTISTFTDIRLLQMMLNKKHSFDKAIEYIYFKQLEEASIVIINKTDLADKKTISNVEALMKKDFSNKILLFQNSLDNESIVKWLNTLDNHALMNSLSYPPLDIDYDIYATGEAKLAWLDQSLEIYSNNDQALNHVQQLIELICKKIRKENYTIGHLKFLVDKKHKISLTSTNNQPWKIPDHPQSKASLLINIRLETTPGNIQALVAEAIRETKNNSGCKILITNTTAFQPGYPKPVHRM